LPEGPGETRGAALFVEGSRRAPILVGSRRSMAAVIDAFKHARG
jgi:hypothetical protein